MTPDQAFTIAMKTLEDDYLKDKNDNLDNFRHIAIFLAKDILVDLEEIERNSGVRGYFIRKGIMKQIEQWTVPQIREMYRKLGFYLNGKWTDKPTE